MDDINKNDFIVVPAMVTEPWNSFEFEILDRMDDSARIKVRQIGFVYKVIITNGFGLLWAQLINDKDANYQLFNSDREGIRKATPHDIAEYRMYLKSLEKHKMP